MERDRNLNGVGITTLCLDVDGVMTNGKFTYTAEGKVSKEFGPEDSDALQLLSPHIEIRFVSADARGFKISEARIVRDMGFSLDLVSSRHRLAWLEERYELEGLAYMGDSFTDVPIFAKVGLALCPQNASPSVKKFANFVTRSRGGSGAVAEAVFYLSGRLGLQIPEFPDA